MAQDNDAPPVDSNVASEARPARPSPPTPSPPPGPPTPASSSGAHVPISAATSAPPIVAAAAPQTSQNGDTTTTESTTKTVSDLGTVSESDMSGYYTPKTTDHNHGYVSSYIASSTTPSYAPAPASTFPLSPYAAYATSGATGSAQPYEPYRASPLGSNPIPLPSMRTIDAIPQVTPQPPQQSARGASMPRHALPTGISMPMAQSTAGTPFYPHQPPSVPSSYGFSSDAMSHYGAPHDSAVLGSRGSKKDIKRRTKTGCLTCRRRRIKCDETYPSCNNCRKSKRNCLGYDPIFKQAAGGSFSSIAPQSTLGSQSPTSSPFPSSSAQPSATVSGPSSVYSNQPTAYTPNSPTRSHSRAPSGAGQKPHVSVDHTAPLITSQPASGQSSLTSTPNPTTRGLPPHPTSEIYSRSLDHKLAAPYNSSPYPRAQKMRVEDIIGQLLGPFPPAQPVTVTGEVFNEMTKVYHEIYAPSLSAFFETGWYYFTENGNMTFPRNPELVEQLAMFLRVLEAVETNDPGKMASSGVFETKIVWDLARTAYQSPDNTNSAARQALPRTTDPTEARNRLRVVESLLCGDYLSYNPLAPAIQDADHQRTREFEFWYSLADFVCTRDQPTSPAATQAREDALSRMRRLLDGRENRDVLYSIAVVRELAPDFDAGQGGAVPHHLDETDPKHRLSVASKFIMDEAQVTGGTTNVVRRFSDIALRAFINPGVNIARKN